MFKKILLVPESNSIDQAAVRRLAMLADGATQTELFGPVHEPLLDGYLGNTEIYEPLRRRVVQEESEGLAELAGVLKSRGLRCTPHAAWDWPLDQAIASEAAKFGADLVIVSPGHEGRRSMGSSDWRLVASCPAPILVVKSDGKRPYRNIVAALDPLHAHSKPADLDDAIAACAEAVRQRTKANLSLVHCYLPLTHFGSRDSDATALQHAEQALEKSRRQELEALAAKSGSAPSSTRLIEGKAQDVLEAMAADDDVDLVVMGGLSRGRLSDFLIGSTAEHMLHHAKCDLLIVKPPHLKMRVSVKA